MSVVEGASALVQQQASSLVGQFASLYELGMLRKVYCKKTFGSLVGSIIPYLVGIVLLIICFLILRQVGMMHSFYDFGWIALFVITMCFFTLVILGSVLTYRQELGTGFYCYEYGLMWLQYSDKKLVSYDVIHWQDIAIVWHEIDKKEGDTSHLYRLQREDGTFFGDNSFTIDYAKVVKVIKQETLRHLWPVVMETYRSGLPVTFGELAVSWEGIHNANRLLTWPEVGTIFWGGNVIITTKIHWEWSLLWEKHKLSSMFAAWGWAVVLLKETPNVHVLRALLAFIREGSDPDRFNLKY